jgi:armadillo repeat-containing protein 8
MGRAQGPSIESLSILSHLQSARTYADQAAALRSLKNEVVGHIQRKELWIKLGALDPVVKILASCRSPMKHVQRKDVYQGRLYGDMLTDEEAVRLQAVQLLSSFASSKCHSCCFPTL